MMRAHRKQPLSIHLSSPQLELLRRLKLPLSEKVLATASLTDEGFELTGTMAELEDLVGWVAYEANHTRSPLRAELLNEIADELEDALATNRAHIRI
jgi:hypothetical protein